MGSLLERLSEALAPRYKILHELARGGMGAVFLAQDTRLQSLVAIKVLLPELATAERADRFLQEARTLRGLSHPHIVPVHDVDENDGLFYYVMDYIEDETLADCLERGPLSRKETRKLGRDLLDALERVHKAGIVHRDIKPANVFFRDGRAILVDFGIAEPSPDSSEPTAGARQGGTPAYMPPEQGSQRSTPRTDIYAVGMVLYEALTCRQWISGEDPDDSLWSGVPWYFARVFRKALAIEPGDRWPNAETFRRRLWLTRVYQYRLRAAGLVAFGFVAGVAALSVVGDRAPRSPPPGSLAIRLHPFEQTSDAERPWLADSLSHRLERSLRLVSEFRVLPREAFAEEQAGVDLHGVVSSDGSGVSLQVWSESRFGRRRSIEVLYSGADWESVADTVANRTIVKLWSDQSPLARWLPREALPVTPRGFDAWLRAERLLNRGQWSEAQVAFHVAIDIDSTCFLCSWRIGEVNRWLFTRPIDSVNRHRVLDNLRLFPPHFRRLIQARLELTDRLDTLRIATEEWEQYYYSWFLRGEEEFNRGPLHGLLRVRAATSLEAAAKLRPEFAPIWWELAWIYIAEGDRVNAAHALEMVPEPLDEFSTVMALMLDIAFGYRFGESDPARGLQQFINHPWLPLAQRLLPSFDVPEGAVEIGEVFTNIRGRPELRRSGLTGQLLGFFAMGRMDAARERGSVFQRDYPGEDGFPLFVAQLEAVNSMFDPAAATVDLDSVTRQLQRYASPDAGTPELRGSARWILQLLRQRNETAQAQGVGVVISDPTTDGSALSVLLQAERMARANRPAEALALVSAIRAKEIADVVPDKFFRTVLHLLMADWYVQLGQLQAAIQALRWHEAFDLDELPTAGPVAQEIDWAFGTLARWKRAQLLDRLSDTGGETCNSYQAIARLWARGDGEYGRRANQARLRFDELECG